jgi:hypothetical protein
MLEKITIKPNLTGEAVKRRDPNSGPLTEEELKIILESIRKLLKEDKIPLFILLRYSISNNRKEAITANFVESERSHQNGRGLFSNIPKVKQRKNFRSEFSMMRIDDSLYENL